MTQRMDLLLDRIRECPTCFYQTFVQARFFELALAGLKHARANYVALRGQVCRILSTHPVELDLREFGTCEVGRFTALQIARTMLSSPKSARLSFSAGWAL